MYTAMYTVEEDFLLRLLKSLDIISEYGTPGEIRTPDPLVRSQVLYPAELRAHITNKIIIEIFETYFLNFTLQ